MHSRRWDTVLGQILGVLGAGTAPLTIGACGGETTATSQTGGAAGASANTGGASGDARSSTGGSPVDDASIGPIFTTDAQAGSGGILSDGADGKLPTYRVPKMGLSCPDLSFHEIATPVPNGKLLCAGEAAIQFQFQVTCVDRPSDGGTCEQAYDPVCMANHYVCGLLNGADFVCGPLPNTDDGCCYVLAGGCAVGRPFFVGSVARTAKLAPGRNDWTTERHPNVTKLGEDARAALSDAYAREGLSEHASVAAFARFTLQCLSLGAPSDIVRGAVQAGLDEIEHARLCFGLASAYAGRDIGPGGLDVKGAIDETMNLESVACSVAREGCVAETISALMLAAARDAAEDEIVKMMLAKIAAEEIEHALLAWRFVRWAVEVGGAPVRSALATVFANAVEHVGFGAVTPLSAPPAVLRAHGYLSVGERRAIATAVLCDVVAPAAEALSMRPCRPAISSRRRPVRRC